MKNVKRHTENHVSKTNSPYGDYYGTGIKNPVGRSIENMGLKTMPKSKVLKPPRSLA